MSSAVDRKAEMKDAGATDAGLRDRPSAHGFEEADASITTTLMRVTFAATFLLACLAALAVEGLQIAESVEL